MSSYGESKVSALGRVLLHGFWRRYLTLEYLDPQGKDSEASGEPNRPKGAHAPFKGAASTRPTWVSPQKGSILTQLGQVDFTHIILPCQGLPA